MNITRNTLLLTTSLVMLLGACNKDKAVDPADPLYRTWQLVQTQTANQSPKLIPLSERITIAFQPGGKIVYDHNGQDGGCCMPRRFEQRGQVLFVDNSIDQPEYCKYVDIACTNEYAFGSSEWVVVRADANELVLQIGDKLLSHQPYR